MLTALQDTFLLVELGISDVSCIYKMHQLAKKKKKEEEKSHFTVFPAGTEN